MPKVSIIIPTYNRAAMVCDAIDSVLAQSYRDFEVLVVDDGSTDGTQEVLRERYGDRIRYFYQENQGRAAARNKGIRESEGKYLVFLDSDDWLLPNGLEIQVGFLDRHPEVDVVYGDGYYCDAQGRRLQRIAEERPAIPEDGLLAVMVLHNLVVATHSAMVRRRTLELLGDPWFDESLRGTEDADLWLRVAAAGACFASHDEPICMYRLHGGNASSRTHPRWARRWRSVQRFKRKTLEADFFPALPLWSRREFLRQMLLTFFDGEPEVQAEIVASDRFRALPREDRALLLYRLGVETVARQRDLEGGRRWLAEAMAESPCWKYRLVLALSRCRGFPLRALVGLRRHLAPRRPDRSLAPHWQNVVGG